MLIIASGRVGGSAVEVPLTEVRAGHGDVDEILKVIDAESTMSRPTAPELVSLLTATTGKKDTDRRISDIENTVESTRDGMEGCEY